RRGAVAARRAHRRERRPFAAQKNDHDAWQEKKRFACRAPESSLILTRTRAAAKASSSSSVRLSVVGLRTSARGRRRVDDSKSERSGEGPTAARGPRTSAPLEHDSDTFSGRDSVARASALVVHAPYAGDFHDEERREATKRGQRGSISHPTVVD